MGLQNPHTVLSVPIYLCSDWSVEDWYRDGAGLGGGDIAEIQLASGQENSVLKSRMRTINKVTHLPGFSDSPWLLGVKKSFWNALGSI